MKIIKNNYIELHDLWLKLIKDINYYSNYLANVANIYIFLREFGATISFQHFIEFWILNDKNSNISLVLI